MNQISRIGTDLHALVADPAMLDLALEGGDIAPLLMVLVHLTGEEHWLDEVAPHINGPWNFQETVPDELKARVRARLREVLLDHAARGDALPSRATSGAAASDAVGRRGRAGARGIPADDPRGDDAGRHRSENGALADAAGRRRAGGVQGGDHRRRACPVSAWRSSCARRAFRSSSTRRTRQSAAPGWRIRIPAAGSIRPITSTRCRSSRTTTGRITSPNVTSCGGTWNGWRINTICAAIFVSRPR